MYIITMDGRQLATCEDPEEAVDVTLDNIDDETVDEYIDATEEEVKLFGMTYTPSFALQRMDPTAYRCLQADILDSWRDGIKDDFEHMKDGQVCYYGRVWIEYVEE